MNGTFFQSKVKGLQYLLLNKIKNIEKLLSNTDVYPIHFLSLLFLLLTKEIPNKKCGELKLRKNDELGNTFLK